MLTDLAGSAFGRRSGRLLEFLGRIRLLVGLGRREVGFVLVLKRSCRVGLRQRGYPLGPARLLGFLVSLTGRRLASISTDRPSAQRSTYSTALQLTLFALSSSHVYGRAWFSLRNFLLDPIREGRDG